MNPNATWPFGTSEMAGRIRAFDWPRTSLGPIETWPERRRNIVDMVLAIGFPAVVLVGPDLIQIYNDGYRDLMGEKHPAGLGQPTRACWPEVWHLNQPIYERVLAGETVTFEDALYPIIRRGTSEEAWFTLSYSPLRDAKGSVADILVTVFETTVEHDIHPDDRSSVREAIGSAVRDKTIFELRHRVGRADGGFGWTSSRAVPILDGMSEIAERLGTASDATARMEAEEAFRESEERFRSFAENSADTLWIFNVDRQRLDYLNPAFAAMYGEDPERVTDDLERFAELIHPDDRALVSAAMPRLLAGDRHQIEYRIVRRVDGAVRWIQDTGFPIRDAKGRVTRTGGIAQDVTERRDNEETLRDSEAQLQVMVAELHHRTRNLIGVVGMIARQIIASSVSLADFRVRFTERLEALSRVQGLFFRKSNERISIGDIVHLELDALGADLTSERMQVEGAAVALRKSAVQTLSLAIHELATNARKYGALHGDTGRLAVRWEEYRTETGKRRLRLEWTETGISPEVEETVGPMHKGGYGRKLIEQALPYTLKAKTTYRLGTDRLDCTIDMPLDR